MLKGNYRRVGFRVQTLGFKVWALTPRVLNPKPIFLKGSAMPKKEIKEGGIGHAPGMIHLGV